MRKIFRVNAVVSCLIGLALQVYAQETIIIDLPGLPEGVKLLEMVLISGGTFTMGSPSDERGRDSDESPLHEVTITKPFYMGKYEVTQAQWETVMGSNPAYWGEKPDNPVECVSWNDCQEFIERLNQMEIGTYRLPTEAEWEYACRAGTTTRFSFGDALECDDIGENYCEIADQYMWWLGNDTYNGNIHGTKEVGMKLPNPWGLHDMHGNVFEWCQDWVGDYSSEPQVDPQGPLSGESRVLRGGGWAAKARTCRSSNPDEFIPAKGHWGLGFRLLRLNDDTGVTDWQRHDRMIDCLDRITLGKYLGCIKSSSNCSVYNGGTNPTNDANSVSR